MTHTLASLGKAGFIATRPKEDDARSKRVWIKQEGRTFRDWAIGAVTPGIAGLKLDVGEKRVRAILSELEKLSKITDERRDRY